MMPMIRKKRHSGGTAVSQFQRHDDDELLWDEEEALKKGFQLVY
jgi:hypothetical protein